LFDVYCFDAIDSSNYVLSKASTRVKKRRRSYFEIAAEIIKASAEPAQLTKIVYDSYINFSIAHRYIDQLVGAGLIEEIPETNTYRSTQKGMEYLEVYDNLKRLIKSE
jgi:predicted transcriptional regulator